MLKTVRKIMVNLGCVVMASLGAMSAQAAIYVYQLPDGSRIITDHAVQSKDYKLVRSSQTVEGVGMVAANRAPQFFRADPSSYDRVIAQMARRYEVDPALVKAVVHAESAFNPYATSHKGASGLMQLMPGTAEIYGVNNIYDPVQNIRAGVRYLRDLLTQYDDKVHLAVAAYNAGPTAVARYRGIPPFDETQEYVRKVLRYKKHYSSVARSGA
ncbi:MAG: lytic transglycosylase domain-containing protein [Gammaproteobacteria bacterium]|nr:lytic transglycosylase domain-containing protein [Gammaproteobacteria bacterium]